MDMLKPGCFDAPDFRGAAFSYPDVEVLETDNAPHYLSVDICSVPVRVAFCTDIWHYPWCVRT
jgi:hypothetical protein